MILRGRYPLPIRQDIVAISDGAGDLAAVGAGVGRRPRQRRDLPSLDRRPLRSRCRGPVGGSLDGMLTEYALLDADALVRTPDHLS
jgi:NADPH:quinone reductase-like Zn-dependent oxidoreductase